jgi:hypothetical protein
MAGHGSGDVSAEERGPGGPGSGRPAPGGAGPRGPGSGRPTPGGAQPGAAAPAEAARGEAARGEPQAGVPAQVLRSWDAAEAQLFPLIMARPDAYERSLSLIQLVLAWLRANCADVPALLAQAARGESIVADAGQRELGDPGAAGPATMPGVPGGLRLDLIAAAACAMRYRELAAAAAAARRLDAVVRARAGGSSWAVVEETGDLARVPYLPYQRVEAHVPSGRSLIISAEPDETLVRPVWRLDEADIDLASGRLVPGAEIGSYGSTTELDEALASARLRLG